LVLDAKRTSAVLTSVHGKREDFHSWVNGYFNRLPQSKRSSIEVFRGIPKDSVERVLNLHDGPQNEYAKYDDAVRIWRTVSQNPSPSRERARCRL